MHCSKRAATWPGVRLWNLLACKQPLLHAILPAFTASTSDHCSPGLVAAAAQAPPSPSPPATPPSPASLPLAAARALPGGKTSPWVRRPRRCPLHTETCGAPRPASTPLRSTSGCMWSPLWLPPRWVEQARRWRNGRGVLCACACARARERARVFACVCEGKGERKGGGAGCGGFSGW